MSEAKVVSEVVEVLTVQKNGRFYCGRLSEKHVGPYLFDTFRSVVEGSDESLLTARGKSSERLKHQNLIRDWRENIE